MHPYTLYVPKPLMPGEGRTLLQHQIEFLRPYVRHLIVTVGYKGSIVEKAAFEFGADEVLNIGNNGNAYWLNNEKIRSISTSVVVITCDNLMQIDLSELESETKGSPRVGTIVALENISAIHGNFLTIDGDRILSMNSQGGVGSLIATGLQTIVPRNIPPNVNEFDDFEGVWNVLIESNELALSRISPSAWCAIDTYRDLQAAISQNVI